MGLPATQPHRAGPAARPRKFIDRRRNRSRRAPDRALCRGLDGDPLAALTIEFQQTLRIPDDGRTYPLPAGLGAFPLHSVDDFAATAPASWLKKGGVMMPMDQSEALWIRFSASYPFAVKIAAGKINAVSGEAWTAELSASKKQSADA